MCGPCMHLQLSIVIVILFTIAIDKSVLRFFFYSNPDRIDPLITARQTGSANTLKFLQNHVRGAKKITN